jgi:hypothetical protein
MELHEPEVSPQRIAELEISRQELLCGDKHDERARPQRG